MLKVVKPNADRVNGEILDGIIVKRTAKSGREVFNIMVEEKQLSLSAGFIGGKKQAFVTADSLDTMRESIEEFGIRLGAPIKGFRIVYNETLTPPESDDSWAVVPMVFEGEDGELETREGSNVTCEGAEIYRQRRIVPTNSDVYDALLPHDKIETGVVTEEALSEAAKSKVK